MFYIQLLIHIAVFITYISWWITTPVSPEDICIFSQGRKPLFSAFSEELAKLEKEWFECTWLIFPMRLCWTTAEYKRNVRACYYLEMYSSPPTYMNCFKVCPPDLWFLCPVHLFSLFECDCVVPGSFLWHCAEAVSAQEWIYYQSIRWHSSPACFLRLSWLCIIAVTVTLSNEVIHPTLSRIMRPTKEKCA